MPDSSSDRYLSLKASKVLLTLCCVEQVDDTEYKCYVRPVERTEIERQKEEENQKDHHLLCNVKGKPGKLK